jgi:G3E family GTPase
MSDRPESQPAAGSPIPLTILTGFLGAGKTTLLNRILTADHGLRVAVLVNDFGAINIDAQLIANVEGDAITLANGCICCTIRGDLLNAVLNLTQRPDAPQYILLETSGVSDPVSVAQTFLLPELRDRIVVDAVLTVVDADQLPTLKGQQAFLAMDQMAVADIIILNKIDLVTPEQLERVKRDWLYPQARVIETSYGAVPLELLLSVGKFSPESLLQRQANAVHVHEAHEAHEADSAHDHDHPPIDHSMVFSTWHWAAEKPLSFKAFKQAIRTLPSSIFRAKGIVYIADDPQQRAVLQMVGQRASITFNGPWQQNEKPHTQLVFIGGHGGINPAELAQRFEACLNDNVSMPKRLMQTVSQWLRGDN